MKDHEEPVHDLNFIPHFHEIDVDYDAGTTVNVTMHDGSTLRLRKLEKEYDPHDKKEAIKRIMQSHDADEVLTGVLYLNTTAPNFLDMINMTDQPLATLPESMTRPSREALEACMDELR
jgi:2-oxoglutarate ferredoxin oxidoreductase subunit beta